jgi:Domain of unknown function (DUF4440)
LQIIIKGECFVRCLFVVVALLAIAPISFAQVSKGRSNASGITERVIKDLDSSYNRALTKQDLSALDLILADDYFCTSSKGSIRGKTEEVEDARPAPDFIMPSFRSSDVKVRLYSSVAVVTGRVVLSARYPDKFIRTPYRYTRVYTNLKGRLRLAVQQLTLIEGESSK